MSPASGAITTVSTVDPIKVYFTASEQEYLDFARRFPTAEKRQADNRLLELELILADGITYPHKGKFYFADRQVDVRTGAIRLAGLFPNPGNSLRPGQYGRVRTATQTQTGSSAGSATGRHRPSGHASVAVVDGANKVTIRTVNARRDRRHSVDRSRRRQAGRARGRRRPAEGPAGNAGRSEAVRSEVTSDVEILHQPSDRGDGDRHPHRDRRRRRRCRPAGGAVPRNCAARSSGLRNLRRRGRPDHRAIGGHSHRAADERRRQHELHVFAQRHRQRADAADRRFRRGHGPEYRSDSGAKPRDAGRVAAPRGCHQLRRHRAEIGARAADAGRPVLAQGHLRCQVPGQLRLHQPERPADAREGRRHAFRYSAPASTPCACG